MSERSPKEHRPSNRLRTFREGGSIMRESVTYQAILREGRQEGIIVGREEGIMEGRIEGRIEGERRLLVRQGTKRFGVPDAATVTAIEAIEDLDRFEALGDRILDAGIQSWDDLLRDG
jgi:predicted transposase YdaD